MKELTDLVYVTLLQICFVTCVLALIIQAIENRLSTYERVFGIITISICITLLNFYSKGH